MLLVFDLDGTLISSYMENPDRDFHTWQLLPGRQHKLAQLRHLGHDVAIVSNQGGVAFGLTTEQDVITKLGRVAMALGYASIWVHDGRTPPMRAGFDAPALECHICYSDARSKNAQYREPADVARRKPSGAMIREAMAENEAAAADGVLFVGDRPEDEAAARDAGVAFQWADEFFSGKEIL